MATLAERMIGAARLDAQTFEEVEHDEAATTQAMLVVVLASLASGIAVFGQAGFLGLLLGAVMSLVGWVIWAAIVYFVGTRILPTAETEADLGQLLRTIGFSASPGILAIFGVIPGLGVLIRLVASLWQLAAMVVAVRQALDYESTGRAVGVCLLGWLGYLVMSWVVLGLLGIGAAGTGAIGH